jgi:hypothetical protein
MNNEKTTDIGDQLEEQVAGYYRALGYSVERNRRILGSQIDLVAEKHVAGSGTIRLAIEVKSRTRKSITPSIVQKFKQTVNSIIKEINGAILVADADFSLAAKETVADLPIIRLYTIRELENELFGYAEAGLQFLSEYRVSSEAQYYVPIHGASASGIIADVASHLVEWCYSGDHQTPFVIIGDFGAGKSTIAQRVAYHILNDRQIGKNNLFPILLQLRSLQSHPDIFSFVAKVFSDYNGQPPSPTRIRREYELGRLVILLDGFDEIDTSATALDKARYIERLAPVLTGASPCILTTRPTYFDSFYEMRMTLLRSGHPLRSAHRSTEDGIIRHTLRRLGVERIVAFEIPDQAHAITLSVLDPQQVQDYIVGRGDEIRARLGLSIAEFEERIYKIQSVSDLARRPLLLFIIVDTALQGGLSAMESEVFNAAQLYHRYVSICAFRDEAFRNQQVFTPQERLDICGSMAIALVREGKTTLSKSELSNILTNTRLENFSKREIAERIDEAITDVQVCTFLSWGEKEATFRFSHRSILEFFAARRIVDDCRHTVQALYAYSKQTYSLDIFRFLADFLHSDSEFQNVVLSAAAGMPRSLTDAKSFVCSMLMASGTFWTDTNFDDVKITNIRIADTKVDKAELTRARLHAVEFLDVTLLRSKFLTSEMSGGWMRKINARHCVFQLNARGVELADFSLHASEMQISGRDWLLERFEGQHTKLRLGGTGILSAIHLSAKSVFYVDDDFSPKFREPSTIRDSVISADWKSAFTIAPEYLSLSRSTVLGVRIEASLLQRDTSLKATFQGCRGIVVVSEESKPLEQQVYTRANGIVRGIFFVSSHVLHNIQEHVEKGLVLTDNERDIFRRICTTLVPFQAYLKDRSLFCRMLAEH